MNKVVRGGAVLSTRATRTVAPTLPTLTFRRQGVVRALDAMQLRLADRMSLAYLAKTAAMSRFHFERVFQQVTGLAPFQFLAAMRLVRARDLVINTNTSIAAICFEVGYRSIGTFTRRFTEAVGASPGRLRRWLAQGGTAVAGAAHTPGDDVGQARALVVRCRGVAIGRDTRIFVGVFPSPMPIGRPLACASAAGTDTLAIRDVPAGRHYVLGAARPARGAGSRLAVTETVVGIASPAPVDIEGPFPQEVTMLLRPIEVTDPPVVSFLPLLLHESHGFLGDDAPDNSAAATAVAGVRRYALGGS